MNPLAFNMEFSKQVRTKINIALSVFPVGFMFGSFGLIWAFSRYLAELFGIPHNTPIREHPNGLIWFVIFLVVMILFMISGYLLGWLLNAMVTLLLFSWPKDKVKRVFLYSEIPATWLKDNVNIINDIKRSKIVSTDWSITRQKGKWHFVILRGVLSWGIPMFLLMAFIPILREKEEPTVLYFIWQAILWGAAGGVFGLIIWSLSERSYIRRIDKKSG